nr:unnamed protein product [Spirometra erinaceieuropaei]
MNEGLAVLENITQFACGTEAIWLTIKATGSPRLDVLTVYLPPRTDQIADTQLMEQLEKFSSPPSIMIMGVFNAPGTNWNTLQTSGAEVDRFTARIEEEKRKILESKALFESQLEKRRQNDAESAKLLSELDRIQTSCFKQRPSPDSGDESGVDRMPYLVKVAGEIRAAAQKISTVAPLEASKRGSVQNLDTVRQDMEVALGPSVFGLRRWRRE